jgi:transcription elongation factor GreA
MSILMTNYYTEEALKSLDKAIEDAETKHKNALLLMGEDTGHETWHDNPAFDQAKQDVDAAASNLRKLKQLRNEAVVAEGMTEPGTAGVGSTITIQFRHEAIPEKVHLLGYFVAGRESDDEVFSLATTSPLGAALLGHSVGDEISYSSPSGKILFVKIQDIEG